MTTAVQQDGRPSRPSGGAVFPGISEKQIRRRSRIRDEKASFRLQLRRRPWCLCYLKVPLDEGPVRQNVELLRISSFEEAIFETRCQGPSGVQGKLLSPQDPLFGTR